MLWTCVVCLLRRRSPAEENKKKRKGNRFATQESVLEREQRLVIVCTEPALLSYQLRALYSAVDAAALVVVVCNNHPQTAKRSALYRLFSSPRYYARAHV